MLPSHYSIDLVILILLTSYLIISVKMGRSHARWGEKKFHGRIVRKLYYNCAKRETIVGKELAANK